jgi:hypothetical protein
MILMLIGGGLALVYVAGLILLYWEAVRPTNSSKSYLSWYRKDAADREATEAEWKAGNWS